jgi:hypothetical protein
MMKKIVLVSFLAMVIFLLSCKKEKASVLVNITEKGANTPVSGATVVVYKCGVFNCNLGSIDLFSGVTDNNGNCKVPAASYNEAAWVRVLHEKYWSWDEEKSTAKSMVPAGWLRMRIVKSGTYSANAILNIIITSQSTNSRGAAMSLINNYNSPADSSVLIKCFGGELNKIVWQVSDQSNKSGTFQQQVPRLDTVNIVLNY